MSATVRAPRRFVLASLAVLATCAACGSHGEAVLRFEAERARWRVDRLERRLVVASTDSAAIYRRLRHEHTEIARRFGPERALGAAAVLDDDARVRYRIAGSSALYAADLAARDSVTEELCAQYAALAARYSFDAELALRARIREGLCRESRGERSAAFAAYSGALESPVARDPFAGDDVPAHERLRADLEVHVALLARDVRSPQEAAQVVQEGVERLRRHAAAWKGHRGETWLQRRVAELLAIAGRGDEAVALLQELFEDASTGGERAEVALLRGEVEEVTRQHPQDAETWYQRAVVEGAGRPVGADARLHLGHLLRAEGRANEAADVFSIAIVSGASTTAAHRAEALYGQARCLTELDRGEDALLTVTRGAAEEGPFGLASAARRVRHSTDFDSPDAEAELSRFVERAGRARREASPSLSDFSGRLQREREAEAWADVVDELRRVAVVRSGTALGDSARGALARLSASPLSK